MEDQNFDGEWDIWWRPAGRDEDGNCLTRAEADTDHDGTPDRFTIYDVNDPPEIGTEDKWDKIGASRDLNPN